MNLVDKYCNTIHQKLLKYELISKKYSKLKLVDFTLEHNNTYNQFSWTVNGYVNTSDISSRTITY